MFAYNPSIFRDKRDIQETYKILGTTVDAHINQHLQVYIDIHHSVYSTEYIPTTNIKDHIPLTAVQLRMAFSCLVDADHTDTSIHFGGKLPKPTSLLSDKRIEKLIDYEAKLVNEVSSDVSAERLNARREFFKLTSICEYDKFNSLDAPVGLGKTLSGTMLALRIAKNNDCERIFTILPFTNIISQTVKTYNKSIRLYRETKRNINEIHSKCEFESANKRQYSNLWNSPINVSTAVQFFESLTSNRPGQCRKLHQFANSVIILDEMHSMLPHHYWDYILPLLKDLSDNFNIHFITSSGSSVYYWKLFEFDGIVNDILSGEYYNKVQQLEQNR